MAFPNIPVTGSQPKIPELTTAQFVIPAGAGATFAASNNIATVTFNAAHGLTMNPSAGTMPNYYIGFGGTETVGGGTGVLVGNVFRILSIPSTTAITIYTTITSDTITSLTGIPVFFPNFLAGTNTVIGGEPTQTISTVVTKFPFPQLSLATVNCVLGANAAVRYNPSATFVPLDQSTGSTPATAPTWRDLISASGKGQFTGAPPYTAVWANGSTATSYFSVID